MKPEQQRIAIAEACGWRLVCNGETPMWSWQKQEIKHRIRWAANKDMASQGVLPDYLNDLNAMHEAEKVIGPIKGIEFCYYLNEMGISGEWEMLTATAAQRAEAFLRTLNLWRDDA